MKYVAIASILLLFSGCGLKVLPYDDKFACGGDPKKLGKCSNAIDNLLYAEDQASGQTKENDEIYELGRKLLKERE